MSLPDLVRLQAALGEEPLPANEDTITALRLLGAPRYHLGRTHRGELCALIETGRGPRGADVRLRNLEVRQAIRCRVRDPGTGEHVVEGSLVICKADQPGLLDLFLRLYADAIADLGPAPTAAAVGQWLTRLSALLSRLEQDGQRRLQGLWAELLLIHVLGDPTLLLRRWRPDPRERFDFLASGFALEVKSCQNFERVHKASLEQLRPPAGLEVWIASVVVRQDPAGTSVLDLLARVERQIPEAAARTQLREIALATGGTALDDDDHFRFDVGIARDSLRFFDVAAIPSLSGPVPPEVLSVTLQIRCDSVPEGGRSADALARLSREPG